ncbi:DUF3667 domain-containing protein [Flavobacterium sp.]|uniref:DUF3667 domain-containing protein n=1 Tax=Flavobacterium sp. TaxID=239 RepID=UPI00286AB6E6|nr:DUF3667 domain-containing protein [Flavobacterium sp.]
MSKNCLNCDFEINSNFCPNCGQKTTVHQYSIKHFIEHDLVHGFWHVDKGVLYTIKAMFTAPGHNVREFILGKRAKLFSFFSLLLIIIGVSHFIGSYSNFRISDIMPDSSGGFMKDFEDITKKNPKLVLLMTIPFYSIFTFFWFKKAKLNLTEHFVLNSYRTAGELIITTLFTLITVFYTNITGLGFIFSVISLCSYIYSFWFYRQFFSAYGFTKRSLITKSILSVCSYFFLSFVIGIILGISKLIKHSII